LKFLDRFSSSPLHQFSCKSAQWEPHWYLWTTDSWTKELTTWYHFSWRECFYGNLMTLATVRHTDLHLQCLMLLADFIQIWIFMTEFHNCPKYQVSWKSINWELHWYMWQVDRRDKVLHATVNRTKNGRILHFRPPLTVQMYL